MTKKQLYGDDLVGFLVDIKYGKWHYDCKIIGYHNKLGKDRHYLVRNKGGRVFKRRFRHLINARPIIKKKKK